MQTRQHSGVVWKGFLCALLLPLIAAAGDDKGPTIVEGRRLINGVSIYCKSIGTGIPLVIVHGGPGMNHSYLLPQMMKLAEICQLIFFDQRGSGKSSAEVDTNAMSLSAFVEDIEGIRQAYNLDKMNLLGHSWGGLLAMHYAIRHGSYLNSLILVNTTPASSDLRAMSFKTMELRTSDEDSLAQAALVRTDEFKKGDAATMVRFFRFLLRGTFYNRKLADSLTLAFGPDYAARSNLLRYLYKEPQLLTYNLYQDLERISCPVLIVGSDFDLSPPVANEEIHRHIPGSEYVTLRNCGHFPFIEAPDEFFRTIRDFLQRTDRP